MTVGSTVFMREGSRGGKHLIKSGDDACAAHRAWQLAEMVFHAAGPHSNDWTGRSVGQGPGFPTAWAPRGNSSLYIQSAPAVLLARFDRNRHFQNAVAKCRVGLVGLDAFRQWNGSKEAARLPSHRRGIVGSETVWSTALASSPWPNSVARSPNETMPTSRVARSRTRSRRTCRSCIIRDASCTS